MGTSDGEWSEVRGLGKARRRVDPGYQREWLVLAKAWTWLSKHVLDHANSPLSEEEHRESAGLLAQFTAELMRPEIRYQGDTRDLLAFELEVFIYSRLGQLARLEEADRILVSAVQVVAAISYQLRIRVEEWCVRLDGLYDAEQRTMLQLSEREQEIIQALAEAKAFDDKSSISATEIAYRICGESNDGIVRNHMSTLRRLDLTASRAGKGTWLSPLGRASAQSQGWISHESFMRD